MIRTFYSLEDAVAGKPFDVQDLAEVPGLFETVTLLGEDYKVVLRMWDIGRDGNLPYSRCYVKVAKP